MKRGGKQDDSRSPWAMSLFAFWLLLLAGVFFFAVRYTYLPTETSGAPKHWPLASRLPLAAKKTLVLSLHPHCSCSRASVQELRKALAGLKDSVFVYALFATPKNSFWAPSESELWDQLEGIADVRRIDWDAEESHRFGAFVSGFVGLYNEKGDLLFDGGLTESRGHEGENPASRSLRQHLQMDTPADSTFPTFGCGLDRIISFLPGAADAAPN